MEAMAVMDAARENYLLDLHSGDGDRQNAAYHGLLAATEQSVDWAYEVWDDLVRSLSDKDNHVRAIAAQVLSNLAKSDPDNRMRQDFPKLLNVTRDERFVTARHALQSLWKVGAAGEAQRRMLVDGLTQRFQECSTEKNCTLIRYDIAQGLRTLYDAVDDAAIKETALALIETEPDAKYRKKYASVWRGV